MVDVVSPAYAAAARSVRGGYKGAIQFPRSNPDGIDINVNCLDTQPREIRVTDFDGQSWEKNTHKLASKSKE